MKGFINAMENLPFIVKIILALPVLDIVWSFVRLCRSLDAGNVLGIVLAILFLFVGPAFWWIVDIVCIVLKGHIIWLD